MRPLTLLVATVAFVSASAAQADNRFYTAKRLTQVAGLPQTEISDYWGSLDILTSDGRAAGSFAYGVWYFDGTQSWRMGLTGPDFNTAPGKSDSAVTAIHGDYVSGYTRSISTGLQMPWVWHNGVTTAVVGFVDAEHTSPNGRRVVTAKAAADGTIYGGNQRYYGSLNAGDTAWVQQGNTLTAVGLTDALHTNTAAITGDRASYIVSFDDSGVALGQSIQYSGGTSIGTTAWSWSQGVLSVIPGLTGPDYLNAYSTTSVSPVQRNAAGDILGYSRRALGTATSHGSAAFLQRAGVTTRLGYSDAIHTSSEGRQETSQVRLREDGTVTGVSSRYPVTGTNESGTTAWVYRNGVLTMLGLTGPNFPAPTSRTGYSSVGDIGSSGAIYGTTAPVSGNGMSAWRYDAGTTLEIGIDRPDLRRADGSLYNYPAAGRATGVLGMALRMSVIPNGGVVYWWRDDATGSYTTVDPIISIGNESNTVAGDTDDHGVTVLARQVFNGYSPTGFRAALFSPESGTFDLDARVIALGSPILNIRTLAGLDSSYRLASRVLNGGDRIIIRAKDVQNSFVPVLLERVPCRADLGAAGGQQGADGVLDNNDFIAFVSAFFEQDYLADVGGAGGLPGADGQFNNNDFIAFITLFFEGC